LKDRNAALSSIVRRNYIYFTSLLQEPEAKWKHSSESRGVTITQLDSIDPTLVVYRAEATFVGVGIWDLFAAIATPGVKNAWDRGAEQTTLVQDLGDTSKLWWSKTRATWPVASRDSILVETAYRSPSSIHVFSFSTDDAKLFDSIPSPDAGAIRTQIDLRGWSIESLSPTTAHVTLIEQSDPKGWTSKASATPAAMIASLAGIGDFAIKQGAPPIVTKLRGARLRHMRYETDKAHTRIEYDLSVSSSQKVEDTAAGNVECEIRCDVERWSSAVDMIVDPPPLNVRCVRRHKLSPGGGGLWITIEQAAASLEDDPSRITVRKTANKEKGTVFVNGAKMKTEVEELSEDEAAQLRDQKRTKPKRAPLDVVTSSPKKPMIGSSSPSTPVSRSGTPALPAGIGKASSSLNAVTSSATASTPSSRNGEEEVDVFSDTIPRKPMACSLDVLYLLRRIHAERTPDPAGNPAGWTLVTQRAGTYYRRKLMQSISPTVTIQRTDKVVEGLTAENLLSVVSNLSCRRLWDDKVEASRKLESYGNGATTGFFTTKASFPFRGRAFHLASLTARSGPNVSQVGNGNSTAGPTVYFHASSSYSEKHAHFSGAKLNPTSLPVGRVLIDGWILETLDPYSSMLNYQIPSTRVTHLVAVDYAGSLPVTVNAMWNTQLSRSVTLVEEFVKSRGALPSARAPPFCVEVLGDGRDDDHGLVWSMTDDERKRGGTLIDQTFEPTTQTYELRCTLNAPLTSTRPIKAALDPPLAIPFPRRAAAVSDASTTKGLASAAALTASSSKDSMASNGTADDHTPTAEDDSMKLSRATSMSSIRSTASKSRASIIRKEAIKRKPSDLVVADIEVELKHFEKGYEIRIASALGGSAEAEASMTDAEQGGMASKRVSVDGKSTVSDDLGVKENTAVPWSLETQDTMNALPLHVATFDMPPSAVLAATLDPAARPKKHLVRITLPTASLMAVARANPFVDDDVEDPPSWFTDIQRKGASVHVKIVPYGASTFDTGKTSDPVLTSGTSTPSSNTSHDSSTDGEMDSQHLPVYYHGERISVTHVNKTSAMLQRESEIEQAHAVLQRISHQKSPKIDGSGSVRGAKLSKQEDGLPPLLQRPIAVAYSFKGDKTNEGLSVEDEAVAVNGLSHADAITPSSSGEVGDSTLAALKNDVDTPRALHAGLPNGGASSTTPTHAHVSQASSSTTSAASAQIMSILNSYPLSRLGGASTAVSTTMANGGVFSRKQLDSGEVGMGKNAESSKEKTNGSSEADNAAKAADETSVPGQLIEATEQIRKRLTDVKFNLSTLILVALIAFLIGSLVRSLLEPADFVLVRRLTGESGQSDEIEDIAAREIRRMLDSPDHSNAPHQHATTTSVTNTVSSVKWRELRRLVEIRNLFGGRWDFVIAAARRV
jgi:hypothetical protein